MPTPRPRSRVSLAAALTAAVTATLALGACASAPARLAWEGTARDGRAPLAVRFDNDARAHVLVYLVGEQQEWLLGRVAPGARATLRIPDASLPDGRGHVRLAVVAGERLTLRAAGDPRATLTLAQPAAGILSQRWTYSQPTPRGQLTALRLGARIDDGGR